MTISQILECNTDSEAMQIALKFLREQSTNDFCTNARGANLQCRCFSDPVVVGAAGCSPITNAIARYMVDFSKRDSQERQDIIKEMIRQSNELAPANRYKFRVPTIFTPQEQASPGIIAAELPFVCRSFIMKITGTSNYHMKRMVNDVKSSGAASPSATKKSKAPTPGDESTVEPAKKKRLQVSADANRSRMQKDADTTVSGATRPKSKPAVYSVIGNESKREEAREWLEKARGVLQGKCNNRRRPQESFDSSKPGFPGEHVYENYQFYSSNLLEKECNSIKVLGNADFNISLQKCFDFDDFVEEGDCFLSKIADAAVSVIENSWTFVGPAISIMSAKQQTAWREAYAALKDKPSPSDLIESNKDVLVSPYKYTFRAASLHDQSDGTQNVISAYNKHKDKIGIFVCFYSLAGESYNFVSTPLQHEKWASDNKKARLEHKHGYKNYQKYKRGLDSSDLSSVEKFENDFLAYAEKKNQPRVCVYNLKTTDMLIFFASQYNHATIIPKGNSGVRRALLVFHELIPYK